MKSRIQHTDVQQECLISPFVNTVHMLTVWYPPCQTIFFWCKLRRKTGWFNRPQLFRQLLYLYLKKIIFRRRNRALVWLLPFQYHVLICSILCDACWIMNINVLTWRYYQNISIHKNPTGKQRLLTNTASVEFYCSESLLQKPGFSKNSHSELSL